MVNRLCLSGWSALWEGWDVLSSCPVLPAGCAARLRGGYGSSLLPPRARKAVAYCVTADANTGFMSCLPASVLLTTALL